MPGIEDIPFTEAQQELIRSGGFLQCKDLHEGTCLVSAADRLLLCLRQNYKFYIPIYVIPLLLFNRKKLRNDPINTLKRTCINCFRSMLFLATYTAGCKYFLCKIQNHRKAVDPWGPSLCAAISSLALFIEPHKKAEITLFIMVRFLEVGFKMLNKRGLIMKLDNWELLIFAFAMGVINYHYTHNQNQIKSAYLGVFKAFWN